jgi:capsular polysaccharide biosynthesis protein
VLQTLGSDESYGSSEPALGVDHVQSPSIGHYIDILKRRFFYFLVPFAVISILGLYLTAVTQKPIYFSEGKILVESQVIAADPVGPLGIAAANERILRIQQRVMTRDNLLSIANKFGLFPAARSGVLDLMRESSQIKPVEVVGQPRQGAPPIAFTVGFEYENPEIAMRVASEFVTSIVNEDARSRTSRSTEAVKILTSETRGIEDRLESTQMQILEVARRPREDGSEIPEQEKAQLTALAALKAELIQKTSVYSDSHPAVSALKKRIAAMEKTVTQQAQAKVQSTQADEIEALRRQREDLEKRLAEANGKLATARLSERLDRDQQSERLQIIESPQLPQKPLKSNRLKFVAMAFVAAVALGIGTVIAAELFDGSIRGRHQLQGVVASPLIVSIPYITTPADVIRARWRVIFRAVSVVMLLVVFGGLATALVFHLPVDLSWLDKAGVGFRAAGQ